MKQQEPKGHKTKIKMRAFLKRPIKKESKANIPKWLHKHFKTAVEFKHRIWVKLHEINNIDKLAWKVRENYGFGRFALMFYSSYVPNKKFKLKFSCIGETCIHYKSCRVKHKYKHHRGCRLNPLYNYNWVKRAEIVIIPTYDSNEKKDYTYKWVKSEDKMWKFRWFFNN